MGKRATKADLKTDDDFEEFEPGKRGPKRIEIDWEEFQKLAAYQCTQKDIADFFGISVDTLENRYFQDHGEKLSDFWDKKKGAGRAKLRKIQWDIAQAGSTGMAIFLGKQILGQTDRPMDEEILNACAKVGMTKDQVLSLILQASIEAPKQGKKTFEEFCVTAGYPHPYPKQCEMREFGMEGSDPRILLGSRGYGKTDYITILGIAYAIYIDPTLSFLFITKSRDRNTAIIGEIESACEKNGVMFEKKNATTLKVHGQHGKDPSVSCTTIKTKSLRGRHPFMIILDDPVTEDDVSEATRKHVKRIWNELNKLTKNILVIGQPAHKFDLYAELRPALRKMEVPFGSIPELDPDLEAQRLAGVDEASIQASYFLKILSEGANPFDKINYIDQFPIPGTSVCFMDPSDGGDHTSISIFKQYGQGIAVVGFTWKKAWHHTFEDLKTVFKKYNVARLCFETNKHGSQPLDVLRQVFPSIGVVGRNSNSNKHSRIMAAGTFAHMIHLSKESHKQYTDLVVQYEYGAKTDDPPDSLATGLDWIGLIKGKK